MQEEKTKTVKEPKNLF